MCFCDLRDPKCYVKFLSCVLVRFQNFEFSQYKVFYSRYNFTKVANMKGSHAVYILYHFTKFYATIYMMTFIPMLCFTWLWRATSSLFYYLQHWTMKKNMKFLIFKLKPKTLNFQINIIKTLKMYPIWIPHYSLVEASRPPRPILFFFTSKIIWPFSFSLLPSN